MYGAACADGNCGLLAAVYSLALPPLLPFLASASPFSLSPSEQCTCCRGFPSLVNLDHSPVILPDTFCGHTGQICPHICKCQKYTIHLQRRVDLSLYLPDCFHKLCHFLYRKILGLYRYNHTVRRRQCISAHFTDLLRNAKKPLKMPVLRDFQGLQTPLVFGNYIPMRLLLTSHSPFRPGSLSNAA